MFEWGGGLYIRPIEEFPYLIHRMREVAHHPRWERFGETHRSLIARVLREVERRGPLGSRDLGGGSRVSSYRARTDTGLALYYLWHTGKLVIHGRSGSQRVYDLTSRTILPKFLKPVPSGEAREHLAWISLRRFGLASMSEVHSSLHWIYPNGHSPRMTKDWIALREARGELARVEVDGWARSSWTDPDAMAQLEGLERDESPEGWAPRSSTTEEAATFLAPLDVVCTAGRARRLFNFEYIWDVYVPESRRRWGYYTLPILHGENLRGRADLRYDRPSGVLKVLGFWFESPADGSDRRYAAAVGRGLAALRDMTGARRIDVGGMQPTGFRSRVVSAM